MKNTVILNEIKAKSQELIAASSCCAELKASADAWLKSVGSASEAACAKAYVAELEEDVNSIDGLLGFLATDLAKEHLGADTVAAMKVGAEAAKAKGEKYCICPACQAGAAILAHKTELLDI